MKCTKISAYYKKKKIQIILMGNNINKTTQKLPQTYAFLGDGSIEFKANIQKNNILKGKIVIIQKVLSNSELESYKIQLKQLKQIQGKKLYNNLLLPLQQSFDQETKKMICSQNRICNLKYEFRNLQNTLQAQFFRRKSQIAIHQKTTDVRSSKEHNDKKIALSKNNLKQKTQSYFEEEEIISFFKAMISVADVFHKWTNKSGNYKLNEILIQADSLELQIANCLTLPTFESVYQQYLADPSKIHTAGQNHNLQYLAPEGWFYLKRQAQIRTCNKKSQIFIIGKNILKLMCLSSLQNLYDNQYFRHKSNIQPQKHNFGKAQKSSLPDGYFDQVKSFYNHQIILSHLNEASYRYSKQLVQMINQMLNINYLERPSASKIMEFLDDFHQKTQGSIYEKLIPAMISERNQKIEEFDQQKKNPNYRTYRTQQSSHRRKNTKTSSGEIISIGKNSSRQKNSTKFICQTSQKQQFGCIPLDINAQMVFSEYVSFKQSARESNFF